MHNQDVPRDREAPATKKDIEASEHALRKDMFNLRTELKGDMEGLRTELKGDMAGLRTELKGDMAGLRSEFKGDMRGLREEFKDNLNGLRTELKDDFKRVAVAVVRLEARTEQWARGMRTDMEKFGSRMLRLAEDFAVRATKAERGEIILAHRVDDLDKRVRTLESRGGF